LLSDNLNSCGIGGEDRIEALSFLSRVASIGVTRQPLLMSGIGFATPTPKVTTSKITAFEGILSYQTKDKLVKGVADMGSGFLRIGETIARKSELLHDNGFTKTMSELEMFIDISLGIAATLRKVFAKRALMSPVPVVGPEVNVHVIDVCIGADLFIEIHVAFAPELAFRTNGNEVVLVKLTNETGGLGERVGKGLLSGIRESARLISYLPRHDSRIVNVTYSRIAVSSANNILNVLIEKLMSAIVRGILFYKIHKSCIAIFIRTWGLAFTRVLEIEAVASTPLP
jgi:hypothetical protein